MNNNSIIKSLLEISRITNDDVYFFKIRFLLERYEKEALAGNNDSKTIVEMVTRFEKLVKILSDTKIKI